MSESRFSPVLESPYAGFWRRVGAWLIDGVLVTVAFMLLTMVWPDLLDRTPIVVETDAGPQEIENFELSALGGVIYAVLTALYMVLQESSRAQATLGKRVLRIVVGDLNGRRISPLTAAFRTWPMWLPSALYGMELLGFLLGLVGIGSCLVVAFTQRKQGLHDILAKCLVLRREAVFGAPGAAEGPWQRPD